MKTRQPTTLDAPPTHGSPARETEPGLGPGADFTPQAEQEETGWLDVLGLGGPQIRAPEVDTVPPPPIPSGAVVESHTDASGRDISGEEKRTPRFRDQMVVRVGKFRIFMRVSRYGGAHGWTTLEMPQATEATEGGEQAVDFPSQEELEAAGLTPSEARIARVRGVKMQPGSPINAYDGVYSSFAFNQLTLDNTLSSTDGQNKGSNVGECLAKACLMPDGSERPGMEDLLSALRSVGVELVATGKGHAFEVDDDVLGSCGPNDGFDVDELRLLAREGRLPLDPKKDVEGQLQKNLTLLKKPGCNKASLAIRTDPVKNAVFAAVFADRRMQIAAAQNYAEEYIHKALDRVKVGGVALDLFPLDERTMGAATKSFNSNNQDAIDIWPKIIGELAAEETAAGQPRYPGISTPSGWAGNERAYNDAVVNRILGKRVAADAGEDEDQFDKVQGRMQEWLGHSEGIVEKQRAERGRKRLDYGKGAVLSDSRLGVSGERRPTPTEQTGEDEEPGWLTRMGQRVGDFLTETVEKVGDSDFGKAVGELVDEASLDGKPTLRRGDSGPAVRTLQYVLAQRWGAQLTVDGSFGRGTHSAVLLAQKRAGVKADGVVGPATAVALLGPVPPKTERPKTQRTPVQVAEGDIDLSDRIEWENQKRLYHHDGTEITGQEDAEIRALIKGSPVGGRALSDWLRMAPARRPHTLNKRDMSALLNIPRLAFVPGSISCQRASRSMAAQINGDGVDMDYAETGIQCILPQHETPTTKLGQKQSLRSKAELEASGQLEAIRAQADLAAAYMGAELRAGRAVVVAVSYKKKDIRNFDGTTDHYMVVVGQDGDEFLYKDTHTTSETGRFFRDPEVGAWVAEGNKDYTLTRVMVNMGTPDEEGEARWKEIARDSRKKLEKGEAGDYELPASAAQEEEDTPWWAKFLEPEEQEEVADELDEEPSGTGVLDYLKDLRDTVLGQFRELGMEEGGTREQMLSDYRWWLWDRVDEVEALPPKDRARRVDGLLEQLEVVSRRLQRGVVTRIDSLDARPSGTGAMNGDPTFVPPELVVGARRLIEMVEEGKATSTEAVAEGARHSGVDWNSRLGVPQYRNQNDNIAAGMSTCNVTSASMALERLGYSRADVLDGLRRELKKRQLEADGLPVTAANLDSVELEEDAVEKAARRFLDKRNTEADTWQRVRGKSTTGEQRGELAAQFEEHAQMEDLLYLLIDLDGMHRTDVVHQADDVLDLVVPEGEAQPTTEKLWKWNAESRKKLSSTLDGGGSAILSAKHKGNSDTHLMTVQQMHPSGIFVDDPFGRHNPEYHHHKKTHLFKEDGDYDGYMNQRHKGDMEDWKLDAAQNMDDAEKRGDTQYMSDTLLRESFFYLQLFRRASAG